MRFCGAAGVVGIAVLLVSCTPPYEGKYDWYAGWREGRIVKVGSREEVGRTSSPREICRREVPSSATYAAVSYKRGHVVMEMIVPLSDRAFTIGQRVYLNLVDCKLAPQHVQ